MLEGLVDLNEILDNLTKMAEADGKVTSEEEEFLAKLRSNIERFQSSAKDALADDQISDDEFDDMIILRDRILVDAVSFKSESEDVKNLVTGLYAEINEFVIPGMADDELIEDDKE